MREPAQLQFEEGAEHSGLRVLGIVFVVTGLFVALLGAWYLWGTGWLTAQSQTRLEAEFQSRLLALDDAAALPLDDDARDAAATITSAVAWDVPVIEYDPGTAPAISLEELADIVTEAPPPIGGPLGRITIDRIGVDWIVVEGVALEQLADGPGHMPQTPIPGQPGNAVISGHRTTNGAPFYDLDALEPGDSIVVETVIGTHRFQVVEIRAVAPTDTWVATQWDGGWLTLTSCHPRFSSRQRLIVIAQLIEGPNAAIIHARYGEPVGIP